MVSASQPATAVVAQAIADALPSLSSSDLELGSDGALWFATGEANTGGTSFVGSGVYRVLLKPPTLDELRQTLAALLPP